MKRYNKRKERAVVVYDAAIMMGNSEGYGFY